ncbi:MAG: NDP-sugar synthase [Candidatus Margulisbacteria bacterium]|nr:NDP-sugar synthase [Candidatus Margulisiibacteriota bacterium]
MKALIMAAGYGTRLEPLTIAVPKPMVPIVNIPTMQHNIELLKAYGFDEIVANIHYHPEQIENYFGDGSAFGVNLAYSYEENLLGTAGGVLKMAREIAHIEETFVVLSSDALTDINLSRLAAYHKEKKALVTLALLEVADVSQFGVVVQDEDGKIIAFQEKPNPKEAQSHFVNTGVYVMEPEVLKMIPGAPYDFGRQLFPQLIKNSAPIYGYKMVEYWSDVGNLEQYMRSSYDAMQGRVRIRIPGKKVGSCTFIGEREQIDSSARFEGSVIIGDRCLIGREVIIKDSIIGDKCVIADGVRIEGSVIWSDNMIGREAQVNKAIIGNWCTVGSKAKISEGAVVANRAIVSAGAIVPPKARLKPGEMV